MIKKYILLNLAFIGFSLATYAQVGINTEEPNSTFHVEGSIAKSHIMTTGASGVFNLNETHYTVRVFNDVSGVNLPALQI